MSGFNTDAEYAELSSPPSTPATERWKQFPYADGWHHIDDAGVVSKVRADRFVQTATVTVNTTASETTLLGAGAGSLTLPANSLIVGSRVVFDASGIQSNTGATPTITFRFDYGGVDLCVTAAITTPGTDSNVGWSAHAEFIVRTIGATGTVFAQGYLLYDNGTKERFTMATTATVTIDTTAATALNFTCQWSASAAGNTCSCTNASVTL